MSAWLWNQVSILWMEWVSPRAAASAQEERAERRSAADVELIGVRLDIEGCWLLLDRRLIRRASGVAVWVWVTEREATGTGAERFSESEAE